MNDEARAQVWEFAEYADSRGAEIHMFPNGLLTTYGKYCGFLWLDEDHTPNSSCADWLTHARSVIGAT